MATPATKNLKFMRGDTQQLNITINVNGTPVNLEGYTFRAQIRTERNSGSIAASFTCTIPNPANGQVLAFLSAANSALLPDGVLFWDFEQTVGGVVTTLMTGKCTVLADVTR
jgi:stress response protein SCP2